MTDALLKEDPGQVGPPSEINWHVVQTFDADADQTDGDIDSNWRVVQTLDADADQTHGDIVRKGLTWTCVGR
jgi:hypothetical protein